MHNVISKRVRLCFNCVMPTLRLAFTAEADDWHLRISMHGEGAELLDQAAVALRPPIQLEALEDIRWYLEDFLEDASRPALVRASRVRETIQDWGVELFRTIFLANSGTQRVWLICKSSLHDARIEIETIDPIVDAIPWEILQDPDSHVPLALSARSFVRSRPTDAAIPASAGALVVLVNLDVMIN